MIGWYTDNELSKTVLNSIPNIELKHIKDFTYSHDLHVFYGILRGSAKIMHLLDYTAADYYYIDNGYFDALYIDKSMHKSMEGKFRVVKNGMHEVYPHEPDYSINPVNSVLLIPPSPYSANFYDTTPEDWIEVTSEKIKKSGCAIKIRNKQSLIPLDDDIKQSDAVVAFNSMVVMRSCELQIPSFDTHGVFRNFDKYFPDGVFYDIKKLKAFYEPKQFTLDEIKQGKVQWN